MKPDNSSVKLECMRSSDRVHVRTCFREASFLQDSRPLRARLLGLQNPLTGVFHAGGWSNDRGSSLSTFFFGRCLCGGGRHALRCHPTSELSRTSRVALPPSAAMAFQRLQRSDGIHQGSAICMLGHHGLDSHGLPVIAPSPSGREIPNLGHQVTWRIRLANRWRHSSIAGVFCH